MSRFNKQRAAVPPPTPEPEPELAGHQQLAIALTEGASDLATALRRHPRNKWVKVHVLVGTPAGAPPQAEGATWLQFATINADRAAAILEVLDVAADLGLTATGVAPLDAIIDPASGWLEDRLEPWSRLREADQEAPVPLPLAAAAGEVLVRRLLDRVQDKAVDPAVRRGAAALTGMVVANTPGLAAPRQVAEHLANVLLRSPDTEDRIVALLDGLHLPVSLAARGLRDPLPSMPWDALIDRIGPIGAAAARLFAATQMRPSTSISQTLNARVRASRDPAQVAVALHILAAPQADRDLLGQTAKLLRETIAMSAHPAVKRAAVGVQFRHLPQEARPAWLELAQSGSPEDLAEMEALVSRWGTSSDVPDALAVAHRLLRRRLLADGNPPLGGPLLAFLSRHRGDVGVDALFVEVRARWERLPADIRAYLTVRGMS